MSAPVPEPILRLESLEKVYSSGKTRVQALSRISLEARENDFVCIVGPSGCGKSTLLRVIAGLESATSGRVLYRGKPHDRPRREIGMVFQEYSLLPWRNILDNAALGPELAGTGRRERRERAMEFLRLVGLEDFAQAMPHELSGGMRQRAAIARALANEPSLLLMDEPFGALDAHTRILLQRELLRIWERSRKTIVFVTHGVDEAVYLADRIVVMSARPGSILDVIDVSMPRPRDRADPAYGGLAARILDMLEGQPPLCAAESEDG